MSASTLCLTGVCLSNFFELGKSELYSKNSISLSIWIPPLRREFQTWIQISIFCWRIEFPMVQQNSIWCHYCCSWLGISLEIPIRELFSFLGVYTCPILFFWEQHMNHNLILTFMMRLAGLEVYECPKLFDWNPQVLHHSIFLPDQQLILPLCIKGILYYLNTRRPDGSKEVQFDQHLLKPNTPEWNPHGPSYIYQESKMVYYWG